jgi:monoamine oxidase
LDFLRDAYSHEAPELYHIIGGNDLLPSAFAQALSKEIIYGAPAMLVEQGDQDVRVTFERAGEKQTLAADHLICGVPFTALRQVQFKPALSAGKVHAIAELPYGSVTRVYLQSRRRFWLDAGCNGFADTLDLPMEIWNPSHDQPGQRGLQLGYMYEVLARKVAAMSSNDRIAYFLDLMEKVFPGMREHFEGGTSFSWEEQPYQRGAYAVFKKGAYAAYGPHIARSEGRVHFCGEHASPWPGWMQGALYSGLRAAQEAVGGPNSR